MSNSQSLELLGNSKNGASVYYDPVNSHTATHFEDTPNLKSLVIELLPDLVLSNDKELIEHTFNRIIGKADLIKTTDSDTILYAKRLNRDGYTRFIVNKGPVDSSNLTLILYKEDDFYVLHTAYIGILVPSFPDTAAATPESLPFWREHALSWGTQEVQLGTERSDWPWS